MRCYKCRAELTEHDYCTNCSTDVRLYKKILAASYYFYNQGLEKAKVRDLSGAAVSLKESLKFNKNNIKARNLLGLVYFEIGEVVEALCEWLISKSIKPKKNIAIEYIKIVQNNAGRLESINQAIKKYNVALQYCRNGGEDMGAIQLRALLKSTPNFLRARQLLALIYLSKNEPEAAKRELERCRKIDVNNTITLAYLKEAEALINPDNNGKKAKESDANETVSFVRDNELIIQPRGIKEKKGSTTVLNIIVGIAIGFCLAFFLVLPAQIQNVKQKSNAEIKNIGTQIDSKNLTITELEGKISEQNDKIAALSSSLEAYSGTEGTLLSMENLLKASAMYLENPENVVDIADYITAVDESAWTEDTSENYKALYYALKKAIGPGVSDSYYAQGEEAYRAAQYDDALAYFSSAYFFNEDNVDAIYMLANSYRMKDNFEEAEKYFNIVIDRFPDSWFAGKSKSYISEMAKSAE